ncbi:hypothetical protein [Pseudoxanthomonas kalamensis]|uniref:hypothetical protein n=1 Tax=Pseudoxanthomonas kalamensis TaxID=289483 RepID=UPI001B868B06|nr:hypothetical protein [Pseudoxanthomonas kalamensis]
MTPTRLISTGLLAMLWLSACGGKSPDPAQTAAKADDGMTAIGATVKKALDKAKTELETQNLVLGGNNLHINGVKFGNNDDPSRPIGQITPDGDLLIDGQAVPIDDTQRALLLDYRKNLIAVAATGMDLGAKGADLGVKAAGLALKGVFSGKTDEIEKKIEAEAEKLKVEAEVLCDTLPALYDSQQALAAALPAFVPYATMEMDDISDCKADIHDSDASMSDEERAKLQQDIREAIQSGVREGVQAGTEAATEALDDKAPAGN